MIADSVTTKPPKCPRSLEFVSALRRATNQKGSRELENKRGECLALYDDIYGTSPEEIDAGQLAGGIEE